MKVGHRVDDIDAKEKMIDDYIERHREKGWKNGSLVNIEELKKSEEENMNKKFFDKMKIKLEKELEEEDAAKKPKQQHDSKDVASEEKHLKKSKAKKKSES